MKLSVDNINLTSPYWVIQLDDMLFRFTTKDGVQYNVGFYEDTIFTFKDAYHFFIDNIHNQHSSADINILKTVTAIIEEFFRLEPMMMLYICDPTDNRQAARNRLYQKWFGEYSGKEQFNMYSESVLFEGIYYYAGLIMKKNNPYVDDIIAAFHAIVQGLPEQILGDKQQ